MEWNEMKMDAFYDSISQKVDYGIIYSEYKNMEYIH